MEWTVYTTGGRYFIAWNLLYSALTFRWFFFFFPLSLSLSICLDREFSHLFLVSSEFLLRICFSCCLVAQMCLILCHSMDCKSTSLLCSWRFSRKEYWSGLHAFLQGILLAHRWNLNLLWWILYGRAKIDIVYMKPALIMRIHKQWKVKKEKPKQLFIFYQLIRKKLHLNLLSFILQLIFFTGG